jgi:hypothetical protein
VEYGQTDDITDASYQLGVNKLELLLKTIRFSRLQPNEFRACVRDTFWEHSVVTGLFVQGMAKEKGIVPGFGLSRLGIRQVGGGRIFASPF